MILCNRLYFDNNQFSYTTLKKAYLYLYDSSATRPFFQIVPYAVVCYTRQFLFCLAKENLSVLDASTPNGRNCKLVPASQESAQIFLYALSPFPPPHYKLLLFTHMNDGGRTVG